MLNRFSTLKGSYWWMCSSPLPFLSSLCATTAFQPPPHKVCVCSLQSCLLLVPVDSVVRVRLSVSIHPWHSTVCDSALVSWAEAGKESCKSNLSCFAGWVLTVEVWGRLLGYCLSGVILGVIPGHASDYCFIFLCSNQFDVLFIDMLFRQCSMENGLVFFWYKQEHSTFLSD